MLIRIQSMKKKKRIKSVRKAGDLWPVTGPLSLKELAELYANDSQNTPEENNVIQAVLDGKIVMLLGKRKR